jgi:hypothetical protein
LLKNILWLKVIKLLIIDSPPLSVIQQLIRAGLRRSLTTLNHPRIGVPSLMVRTILFGEKNENVYIRQGFYVWKSLIRDGKRLVDSKAINSIENGVTHL